MTDRETLDAMSILSYHNHKPVEKWVKSSSFENPLDINILLELRKSGYIELIMLNDGWEFRYTIFGRFKENELLTSFGFLL